MPLKVPLLQDNNIVSPGSIIAGRQANARFHQYMRPWDKYGEEEENSLCTGIYFPMGACLAI